MYIHRPTALLVLALFFWNNAGAQTTPYLLHEPIDISRDFRDFTNTYFVADSLAGFQPGTGPGTLTWRRNTYATRHAFNNTMAGLSPVRQNEFPSIEYAADPALPFTIELVSSRTIGCATSPKVLNLRGVASQVTINFPQKPGNIYPDFLHTFKTSKSISIFCCYRHFPFEYLASSHL